MNNNEWKNTCAACAEGTPPERCAYYGEPDGCNAPVRGHHPAGDGGRRRKMKMPKKNKFGEYVYRGRTIQNLGYNRVIGHVRWSVTDEKTGRAFFETDTLRDAIYLIDNAAKGGAE